MQFNALQREYPEGHVGQISVVFAFCFFSALDLITLSLSTEFQIQSSHSSDIYLVATKLKTQIQFLFILKTSCQEFNPGVS